MRNWLVFGISFLLVTSASHASDTCGDPTQGALAAVDAYMDTFNSRNAEANAATLHYPSFRIDAAGDVVVLESSEQWATQFSAARAPLPWHHTLYDSKKIVHTSPVKVHVAVHFTRYLANDEKISEHDSLYLVTCRNGRWGIIARSSFVPVIRPPDP
jgi:hypothetical protein